MPPWISEKMPWNLRLLKILPLRMLLPPLKKAERYRTGKQAKIRSWKSLKPGKRAVNKSVKIRS